MVDASGLLARFGDPNDPETDEALAMHLLEHGVAVVSASSFGSAHCGFGGFRISFAADDARLAEALRRIAMALT